MIVIGLTGSIGQGKSTIARQFKKCGAAVCDSDAIVHALLGARGEAVEMVGKAFPKARAGDAIDRKALGKEVFDDRGKLRLLESLLHPWVRRAQDRFLRRARVLGKKIVVLDIPLLFETGGQKRCDYTVVVIAPLFLQRQRVMARAGMTEEKFFRIMARQMKDSEKRRRADFVIQTGAGKQASLKAVKQILSRVKSVKLET